MLARCVPGLGLCLCVSGGCPAGCGWGAEGPTGSPRDSGSWTQQRTGPSARRPGPTRPAPRPRPQTPGPRLSPTPTRRLRPRGTGRDPFPLSSPCPIRLIPTPGSGGTRDHRYRVRGPSGGGFPSLSYLLPLIVRRTQVFAQVPGTPLVPLPRTFTGAPHSMDSYESSSTPRSLLSPPTEDQGELPTPRTGVPAGTLPVPISDPLVLWVTTKGLPWVAGESFLETLIDRGCRGGSPDPQSTVRPRL